MEKSVVTFAPGRVELLGNHTDYNKGLALAAAIDLGVTIRAEKLNTDVIEVSSETNRGRAAHYENRARRHPLEWGGRGFDIQKSQ